MYLHSAYRVNIYYFVDGCNTYLLHRRPALKAVPENAWLILTGLLVIQSHWQCLYIGGLILLRLTRMWIMWTLQILSKLLCIFIPIFLFHKEIYLWVFCCVLINQMQARATDHNIVEYAVNNNRYVGCTE